MDHATTYSLLERKAEQLGVQVRLEPFFRNSKSPGGLIRLRGQYVALINQKVLPSERTAALEVALGDAAQALGIDLATLPAPDEPVAAE